MKNYRFYTILSLLCFLSLSFQCEEDIDITQDVELQNLMTLKSEIETLANSSICDESTECQFIPFGSKACGGPKSYLVFSTSINTEKLKSLVENFNQKEKEFNIKWGIISDCSLATQPIGVKCENNVCVAVF